MARQPVAEQKTLSTSPKPSHHRSVAAKEPDVLEVKVWAPFKVYFNGEARSVTGVNATGVFDILPRHRNFMTLLSPSDLILQTQEGELKIKISGGLMQVHENVVTVFLDV